MTPPGDDPKRPGVYARLAEEADVRQIRHTPAPSVRWIGWGICLALVAGIVTAAIRANPW